MCARREMPSVVSHLGEADLALDRTERVFDFRADAGLELLDLVDDGISSDGCVERSALARALPRELKSVAGKADLFHHLLRWSGPRISTFDTAIAWTFCRESPGLHNAFP